MNINNDVNDTFFVTLVSVALAKVSSVFPLNFNLGKLSGCVGVWVLKSYLFVCSLFSRDKAVHIITYMTWQGHDTTCRWEYIKGFHISVLFLHFDIFSDCVHTMNWLVYSHYKHLQEHTWLIES